MYEKETDGGVEGPSRLEWSEVPSGSLLSRLARETRHATHGRKTNQTFNQD